MKPKNFEELAGAYQSAHRRVMVALGKIEIKIHDLPAPESDGLDWGHLGDLLHLAEQLEAIAEEEE